MNDRLTLSTQRKLSEEQIKAFFHEEFVEDQVRDFIRLVKGPGVQKAVVVDVGGGCGHFARSLARATGRNVRVLDLDATSIEECARAGVDGAIADALHPPIQGDEELATFNLILHHLVGSSEKVTRDLQQRALLAWRHQVSAIFVNEYIYDSFVGSMSGWLIYRITKSRLLSALASVAAAVLPSLRANTFGVGVRFRSHNEWKRIFEESGYRVESIAMGMNEYVSLPRRLLLISKIRRDSFLLVPYQVDRPQSRDQA